MKIIDTNIDGCFAIKFQEIEDERGVFVKTFNRDLLIETNLKNFILEEEYFSLSNNNVFRGYHFKKPPHDHNKYVYCISGKVIDYFIDIRKDSLTYGEVGKIKLGSGDNRCDAIYLPKGIAHGFYSEEDNSTLVYKTDSKYHPESDDGFNYKDFAYKLDFINPDLSLRDSSFIDFSEFISPFGK